MSEQTATNPVPDPTARLQAAATHLRNLAAAIDSPGLPDQSWHTEQCAEPDREGCACIVAQGRYSDNEAPPVPVFYVADAETPQLAAWIAAMHPGVGEALAAVLDQAAQKVGHYQTAAERIWDLNDPKGLADAEAFLADRVKRLAPALALADAILAGAEQ